MNNYFNGASELQGLNVNGWHILNSYKHKATTGGNFSYGYEVVNDEGQSGFLKALDYTDAFKRPDPALELNAMTNAYLFERRLLEECRNKRLKHVVRIIDSGKYTVPDSRIPSGMVCLPIDYLILEKADESVRDLIDLSTSLDYAWMLRSLHNVAVGIEEMHSIQMAHQDIKPSNILVFGNNNTSKLGDVGRSVSMNISAPHDRSSFAGDRWYSPLELLYGKIPSDWRIYRFSCDMYMFGNLITTYFTNVSLTQQILSRLPYSAQPEVWGETYDDILPQIELLFSECLEDIKPFIPEEFRSEMISMIQQLCEPDILRRGDISRKHLGSPQYSLQKYISRLDYWAQKLEIKIGRILS